MHEQENITLVKQGFEAAMRGDYDTLRPLLTDDVSFTGPYMPEAHGVDEVIGSLKQWDQRATELGMSWEHEYDGM